jgi:hypothetical protein
MDSWQGGQTIRVLRRILVMSCARVRRPDPAVRDVNIANLRAKYADIATIEEVITRFGTLTTN